MPPMIQTTLYGSSSSGRGTTSRPHEHGMDWCRWIAVAFFDVGPSAVGSSG
jgi:hypothetical protein